MPEVYCTPNQFIAYYDSRRVGELLDDTDNPIPIAMIPTNPVLLQLLQEASDEVNAAARCGEFYQVADLIAFAAAANGSMLTGIVADFAFGRLVSRRGIPASRVDEL